jgi:hypothetical protein
LNSRMKRDFFSRFMATRSKRRRCRTRRQHGRHSSRSCLASFPASLHRQQVTSLQTTFSKSGVRRAQSSVRRAQRIVHDAPRTPLLENEGFESVMGPVARLLGFLGGMGLGRVPLAHFCRNGAPEKNKKNSKVLKGTQRYSKVLKIYSKVLNINSARTPEFVLPAPSLCLGTDAAALVPLTLEPLIIRHQGGRQV